MWEPAEGEVRRRFPLRICGQKQIYELASGPEALLSIVDEAPAADRVAWDEAWTLEQSKFLALRAKAREVSAGLAEERRLRGELDDARRRLAVFEAAGHAEILRDYPLRSRQQRALDAWQEGFSDTGKALRESAEEIVPDPLEPDLFGGHSAADQELLHASQGVRRKLVELKERVLGLPADADNLLGAWKADLAASDWAKVRDQAGEAYGALVQRLQSAGAGDASEYGRLVQEAHGLEEKLAGLEGKRKALASIEQQAQGSLSRLQELRRELTARRAAFLREVVGTNPHVRIEAIHTGIPARWWRSSGA